MHQNRSMPRLHGLFKSRSGRERGSPLSARASPRVTPAHPLIGDGAIVLTELPSTGAQD